MPNKDSTKVAPKKTSAVVFSLSDRERAILQNWQAVSDLPPKLAAVVEACGMTTV